MKSGKTLPGLLAVMIIIGGCVRAEHPNRQTFYYVLEYPSPQFSVETSLPVVLQVEGFQTAPLYQTHNMVYRQGNFTRHTYPYHKWRVAPGDLVTHFFARDIRQSGLFKGVSAPGSITAPTHIVEGSVEQFYEHDYPQRWEAVLSVNITLLIENEPDISNAVLFQKTYTVKQDCARKTPLAFAEAMSQAMASASRSIITDIYDTLSGTDRSGKRNP